MVRGGLGEGENGFFSSWRFVSRPPARAGKIVKKVTNYPGGCGRAYPRGRQFAQKTGADRARTLCNIFPIFFQKSIDKRRDKVYNKGVKNKSARGNGRGEGKK